ncbi:CoA-transferase [Streptomyces sp. NPDC057621]|uniref:CoA-transferase n=1 Tax=Streptomyces sp. NPDC057621 TaxID=3346186 RepID=UPI0036C7D4AB
MNKVTDVGTAVADIADGATLAVGGFDLCGIPTMPIRALHRSKTTALAVASNNCGTDKGGHQALELFLAASRVYAVSCGHHMIICLHAPMINGGRARLHSASGSHSVCLPSQYLSQYLEDLCDVAKSGGSSSTSAGWSYSSRERTRPGSR